MSTHITRVCLALLMLSSSPAWAGRAVNEQHSADPRATVQINSVSGSLEVLGWNKSQISITGQLAGDEDSIEISGDAAHLTVQVRLARSGGLFGGRGRGPRLTLYVPSASSVMATLVSADFKTDGVSGDLELHTVSGDSRGQVGGNLKVSSVSGDVRLTALAARSLVVRTVSGDIEVNGGDGETDISTVSGSGHLSLGTQSRLHFKSTSGDMHFRLGLARDANVEGEALSGDVSLLFNEMPAADFEVETHSGEIDNCFGPKPWQPDHSPGQRLTFRSGAASARVRVVTHSGDVALCVDKAQAR